MKTLPDISPNLNLNDQSKVDDSIKQEGVTIHADNGSIVNTNSGNGRAGLSRFWAMLITICFSMICDTFLGYLLWNGQLQMKGQMAEFNKETKRLEVQSREGTMWLLRRDILYWIEFHTARKTITQKEYHRLNDEFQYYKKLNGNYDVDDKWQSFKEKIVGTREITMTN